MRLYSLARIEENTIVEVRLIERSADMPLGPCMSICDAAKIDKNTIHKFPPLWVSEVREVNVFNDRLDRFHGWDKCRKMDGVFCCVNFNFIGFSYDFPTELKECFFTPFLNPLDSALNYAQVKTFLRQFIALMWLGKQITVAHYLEEISDLGNSTAYWLNHYNYIWANRQGAKNAQEMYFRVLENCFAEFHEKNNDLYDNPQFLRLALNHPFFKAMQLDHQERMMEPFKSNIRQIDLKYQSEIQKLDFVVDEGVATWKEKSANRIILKYEINPIIPIEESTNRPGLNETNFNSVNPYIRGYSLCKEIERKLAPGYVTLACLVASLPIKLLSKYIELEQLVKIPKNSLWHPECRLKAIADITEDRAMEIKSLVDKSMAFFNLLDVKLDPIPLFALNNNSFMRGKIS